jgi:alpha-2-macroglobulin
MASGYGRVAAYRFATFSFIWALICAFALLAPAEAAKRFNYESFKYYITDYEQNLAKLKKTVDKPVADLQTELAAAEAANNPRLAAVSLEKIMALSPGDGAQWLKLAQLLAASTPINDQDKYDLPGKLIGAGLKAYLMASTAPQEAQALALAAKGFAQKEDWRPALQAYKESLKLV